MEILLTSSVSMPAGIMALPVDVRERQDGPACQEELFPGCEIGARPPFGPFYGQTVYVDAGRALAPEIVFNAGTHRDAMAMRWKDFVKMVNPIVGRISD